MNYLQSFTEKPTSGISFENYNSFINENITETDVWNGY